MSYPNPIGGMKQLWRSYQTLLPGGRLVWFGVAATSKSGLVVIPQSLAARTAVALSSDGKKAPMPPDITKPIDWYGDALATLFEYLATDRIHPVVGRTVPLEDAARAHAVLEGPQHAGKVILTAGGSSTG